MSDTAIAELIRALSKPFGPEAVRQKRGQGNRMMDYVSHGMVTKRLNDVCPGWQAEMVERWIVGDGDKLHCLGGVMRLTIGGVTREEAGGPTQLRTLTDDLKNTYSDCLKRCAMRFGVALDMWESAEENDEDAQPAAQNGAQGGTDLTANLLARIRDDNASPEFRRKALHTYFNGATDIGVLAARRALVATSGLPDDDIAKLYDWHLARLRDQSAPAEVR